jgi:hypothetical protein
MVKCTIVRKGDGRTGSLRTEAAVMCSSYTAALHRMCTWHWYSATVAFSWKKHVLGSWAPHMCLQKVCLPVLLPGH